MKPKAGGMGLLHDHNGIIITSTVLTDPPI